MSGNTKATLAIVIGAVGLLLGILGTVTAYNAKDAVDTEANSASEIQALVDERFKEAQERQDQLEEGQRTEAEKFVDQLTRGEQNLLQKINGNHRKINRLTRQSRNLRNQVNSLKSRDNELSREIGQVESDQQSDFNQLNQRVNRLNNQVQQLQNQMSRLRGLVGG